MPQKKPYYANFKKNDPGAAADRMLEVYQIIIEANAQGHTETVKHGLALLKNSLDPEQDPILARLLHKLYLSAEAALDAGDPAITGEIIETLKGLWDARLKCDQLAKK